MSAQTVLQTLTQIIGYADTSFDAVAPFLGLGEFTALADALNALLVKVNGAVQKATPTIEAEIAAADAAAKAAELAEGLK